MIEEIAEPIKARQQASSLSPHMYTHFLHIHEHKKAEESSSSSTSSTSSFLFALSPHFFIMAVLLYGRKEALQLYPTK